MKKSILILSLIFIAQLKAMIPVPSKTKKLYEAPSDIKKLYEDLEIDIKALPEKKEDRWEIVKKAYRTLSLRYHPDKPGGSEERFKQLQTSYIIKSLKHY